MGIHRIYGALFTFSDFYEGKANPPPDSGLNPFMPQRKLERSNATNDKENQSTYTRK